MKGCGFAGNIAVIGFRFQRFVHDKFPNEKKPPGIRARRPSWLVKVILGVSQSRTWGRTILAQLGHPSCGPAHGVTTAPIAVAVTNARALKLDHLDQLNCHVRYLLKQIAPITGRLFNAAMLWPVLDRRVSHLTHDLLLVSDV